MSKRLGSKKDQWVRYRERHKPYVSRTCKKCGELFPPRGRQTVCVKCAVAVCKACGQTFAISGGRFDRVFCSRRCHGVSSAPNLRKNPGRKPRTYHLRVRDKHGSAEDRDWREAVFKRDAFACCACGRVGGRLQAHHIKPYKAYPELRHDLNNGQTLCVECHRKTDSYGWANYHKNVLGSRRMQQEVLAL